MDSTAPTVTRLSQIEKLVADEAIRALADRRAVTTALQRAEVPAEQISSVLSIGQLDKALVEANAKGWTVVDMARDWRRVFPFE